MISAPLPLDESQRLESLRACGVLDTPPEPEFEDLTLLAARILNAPIALISLVDHDRQWFKSRVGMNEHQTPRSVAFCAHAILQPDPLIVTDATRDLRFHDNPLVTGQHGVRMYVGAPLRLADGTCPGTLCVLDTRPRVPSDTEVDTLFMLARQASSQLELRRSLAEIRNAHDALRLAKDAADASNRAKDEFLANMSHEIRTPLTAILGYAELLNEPSLGPQDRSECVGALHRNGGQLLQIIDDVLDLAKLEAERMVMEIRDFAPGELLADALSTMYGCAARKGLALIAEVGPDVPSRLRTDPRRLRQVIANLVGNAVKFTDSGTVTVRMSANAGLDGRTRLQIDVTDTGPGISAERMPILFAPFRQVDGSTTRRHGGAGLGLAVSRRIANLLGGDITVASTGSCGSTFSVTIAAERAGDDLPSITSRQLHSDCLRSVVAGGSDARGGSTDATRPRPRPDPSSN